MILAHIAHFCTQCWNDFVSVQMARGAARVTMMRLVTVTVPRRPPGALAGGTQSELDSGLVTSSLSLRLEESESDSVTRIRTKASSTGSSSFIILSSSQSRERAPENLKVKMIFGLQV